MDTEYALKITPAAAEDLENVYRYIKESFLAENTANRFIKEIADKLKLLKYFPYKDDSWDYKNTWKPKCTPHKPTQCLYYA